MGCSAPTLRTSLQALPTSASARFPDRAGGFAAELARFLHEHGHGLLLLGLVLREAVEVRRGAGPLTPCWLRSGGKRNTLQTLLRGRKTRIDSIKPPTQCHTL